MEPSTGEKKKFANLAKLQAEKLSRAKRKYLATTYKDFFSALYDKLIKGTLHIKIRLSPGDPIAGIIKTIWEVVKDIGKNEVKDRLKKSHLFT